MREIQGEQTFCNYEKDILSATGKIFFPIFLTSFFSHKYLKKNKWSFKYLDGNRAKLSKI